MPNYEEVVPSELNRQLQTLVEPYLSHDDPVLMCCQIKNSFLELTARLDVYMITQARLISATAIWRQAKAIRLLDIISVTESYNKSAGYSVIVDGFGEIHQNYVFSSRPLALKFFQTLEHAIQRAKASTSQASPELPPNAEERLKRLTRLHDDKLISDAEFQQKRQDIVNEL